MTCRKKGKPSLLSRLIDITLSLGVFFVLFYAFITNLAAFQEDVTWMDAVLEGSTGDVPYEGSTMPLQISLMCRVFFSCSLLMNAAYPPILSKPGTVPSEGQKHKKDCFSCCMAFPHQFYGEALQRGNNLSSRRQGLFLLPLFMLTM